MAQLGTQQPVLAFTIQAVEPGDTQATRLWHDLHGPSCAGTTPGHWLVARDRETERLLGIAQYFRTFPPEDACGAVLVIPEAVHAGVGEQLLRAMAGQALRAGIRNLGTLVGRHDSATLDLLRHAGMPVRISPLNDELYVEMDLVTFAHIDHRDALPDHPVPEAARQATSQPTLRIDGLVAQPRALRPEDLAELVRTDLAEPFTCEEGWQVQDLTWRGVRLLDVLGLTEPLAEARWVRVSSGDYAVPLALADAEQALLAEGLNGQPLSSEHGAPWRLIVPGSSCFTSVKWVDHLALTSEAGEASGQKIALGRLEKAG
jgi:DMSO/TMAO reductase YedYZ molybdopterin-dependent catalytic subunit